MLELVVFDVDGLMLDTESVWKEAFDQAGNKYGIQNMGSTLFPKLIGKSGRDEKEVLDQYLSSDIQELVIQEWERIGYGMLEKEVPVKPGLNEIIRFFGMRIILKSLIRTILRYRKE